MLASGSVHHIVTLPKMVTGNSYRLFVVGMTVASDDVHCAYLPGADPGGGGALGRARTPGTEGPSSQGQKEGTLVSLERLFNTIQA